MILSAPLLILLVVLIALSAFFSASETAFVALNKLRLRHLVENKVHGAQSVWDLVHRLDKLITTILICNNLVNTAVAAIGAIIFVHAFGERWGILISTVSVTLILLIFGEITPKIFATYHSEMLSLRVAWTVKWLIRLFSPLANILARISNFLIWMVGGHPMKRSPLVTEEEIRLLVKLGREAGLYEEEERRMLERIFHFGEITVEEAMIPIDRVVAVEIGATKDELMNTFLEQGHSRIPIFESRRENIIGIFYVEGLLYLIQNPELFRLEDLIFEPYFVEPKMRINDLLKEFKKRKVQMAVIQREGRAVGLVTLEDLIEEIIGDVEEQTPMG